jgi:dihydroorotate dehydrogenase (NAD+) catalytic subunit
VEGGLLFSQDPDMTEATVGRVKQRTSLPVIAKLGPNVADIVVISRAAVSAGADALTLINTMPAMVIDVESRKPVLGAVTGGLSGPGLRPIAVAAVYKVAQAVDVPVIGVGGIFKAQDALEFIMAGATAVQVGSANLADFFAPFHVLEGLEEYLVRHEINHISELVGVVLHSKGK